MTKPFVYFHSSIVHVCRKSAFKENHLNSTKIIKLTRALGRKDSFFQQTDGRDEGWVSALCKRTLSVRAAALRAVLREALSWWTTPKHKCSSKINEVYDVNDGRKPNRKTVLQKGEKRNKLFFKMLTIRVHICWVLAEQKDIAKKVREVLLCKIFYSQLWNHMCT